jgi:hypothetical protein
MRLAKFDKNFVHKHERYYYRTKTGNSFKAEKVPEANLLTLRDVFFLNNQQIHHSWIKLQSCAVQFRSKKRLEQYGRSADLFRDNVCEYSKEFFGKIIKGNVLLYELITVVLRTTGPMLSHTILLYKLMFLNGELSFHISS